MMWLFPTFMVALILMDVFSSIRRDRAHAREKNRVRSKMYLMLLLMKLDLKSPGKAQYKLMNQMDRIRLSMLPPCR
jgi:hypothetical protein